MKMILILLLFSSSVWAQHILPHDDNLSERIRAEFMEGDSFSSEKVDSVRRRIQTRKEELSEAIRNYEFLYEQEDYFDVIEKIDEEQAIIGFNMILTYLNQIEQSDDIHVQKRLAWKIFELDFSSKVEGNELLFNNVLIYLQEILTDYEIHRNRTPLGEAKNLYDPQRNTYYSPEEVEELIAEGFDISTLNPSPKSHFWYDKDIKNSDVHKTFFGDAPMYEGLDMVFPRNGEGYYKKVKKSQTKPKVHFTIEKNGRKHKFKLKFGAELASEITAGALSANLGFHHDMSKYVQNFNLILPEKMTYLDFKREWLEYYKKYDPEDYINEISEKNGRVVIQFREALIEAKPDELQRLGPWAWAQHQELREVRGMLLFNMWIANNDIKESGNNKLVLRYNEDKNDYDIYQFIHDLGFSFGRFSHEKPGDFPWTLVQHYDDNYIDFKYYNFQRSSGFDHVTYYDGKWMVRKIAQLSRKQIKQAVKIGGWPREVQLLYVEKLIARRNQLVEAFGLTEEFDLIDYDRNISTANGVLENGRLTQARFEGYSQNFGGEIQAILKPIYDNLDYIASQAIIKSASAFDTLVFDAREFGYDGDLVSEIQLTMDREVRRNEIINGNDDNYIVQDTLRVRFGLGVGAIVRGKVNYYKEYKLLYPVKTKRETGFDNKYILKAMLPNLIKDEELPENYVLLMEDGIEGEGEILVGTQHLPISIGVSAALGKLSRTIVSKKLNEFSVYQDASVYKGFYARLYAELLVMRIPVWQYSNVSGILGRYVYTIDLDSGNKEAKEFALEEMLRSGNLEWVEKFGAKKRIESHFSLTRNDFDIFFIENEYRRRVDNMVVYENDEEISEQNIYQVDVERHSEWQFWGNGEVKDRRYRLYGEVDDNGFMSNVLLDMKLAIEDTNATTQEFENAYLPMYNQLSMLDRFFNYTPSLHSINQIWHKLEVDINLSYDKEALDKLIATPDERYYDVMARYSNRDAEFWATKVDNDVIDSNSKFIRNKFHHWMRSLRAARAARSDRERYTILTDAFSNLVWKLSEGYQCLLLGRIHTILGRDMFYMEGMIRQSEDVENTMPAGTPLYNVMNRGIKKRFNMFEFDYRELDEIWELFQK